MPKPGPRYLVAVLSFGFFLIGGLLTYFQLQSGDFPLVGIIVLLAGAAFAVAGFLFLQRHKSENGGFYGTLSLSPTFSKLSKPLFITTLCTAIPGFIMLGIAQTLANPLGIAGLILFMIGFVCHGINGVRAMSK